MHVDRFQPVATVCSHVGRVLRHGNAVSTNGEC